MSNQATTEKLISEFKRFLKWESQSFEKWVTKLLQQIQTNLYQCIQKYRFYETESPLYREIGANSVLIALNP